MFKLLQRYMSIGIINTILHWIIFCSLFYGLLLSQATSNLIAFSVVVTFSFFANTKWTFNSKATLGKYIYFTVFMGSLALFTGYLSDCINLPVIFTLVGFSGLSLLFGFLYSKYIVFKE